MSYSFELIFGIISPYLALVLKALRAMSDEMCLLDPTQVPDTKSFLASFDYEMFRDPSRYTRLIAFCGPQNRIFSIPHKWKTEPIRLYDLDLFEPTDPCLLRYISI